MATTNIFDGRICTMPYKQNSDYRLILRNSNTGGRRCQLEGVHTYSLRTGQIMSSDTSVLVLFNGVNGRSNNFMQQTRVTFDIRGRHSCCLSCSRCGMGSKATPCIQPDVDLNNFQRKGKGHTTVSLKWNTLNFHKWEWKTRKATLGLGSIFSQTFDFGMKKKASVILLQWDNREGRLKTHRSLRLLWATMDNYYSRTTFTVVAL
jgi:hypothetical protein